jgi:hypothetical protein
MPLYLIFDNPYNPYNLYNLENFVGASAFDGVRSSA